MEKELATEIQYTQTRLSLFNAKSIRFALSASIIYLLVSYFLIGFKPDQLFLVFLFNVMYFLHRNTRRFIIGFSIFILYWIIFDYMKAFPNYRYNTVHIGSLYNLEKSIFGFTADNRIVTPNEYFALHHSTALDVVAGICYLCWVPVPLIFAGILFFRNRKYFFYFALTFFLVNIIGFIGYYVYPAAPPWYVAQHGFDFIAKTPGNTAGLARFDALFGIHVFEGLYSKSSNVFAAMPSLHAAYLLIVLYYGIKTNMRYFNLLFAFLMLGIWFSAIYNSHHYVLDVLAGITCAFTGIGLFQWFVHRTNAGKVMVDRLMEASR